MKTLFSKHQWMQIVYGALLLVAGTMVIIVSINNVNNISQWLSIIIAISLFIYASALLFTGIFSLQARVFDIALLYAIVFIAIGVVLVVKWELIGQFITVLIATILCAAGLVEIGQATAMVFFHKNKFLIVLHYILAAVFIALGVLAFSYQTQVQQIAYISCGIILILGAIVELILGFRSLIKRKSDKKLETKADGSKKYGDVIDADVIESKDGSGSSDKIDA